MSTDTSRYVKTVDLPKFAGDPIEWPMFERSYQDSTAEFGYSNVRNIMRLQKALSGPARATVDSLLPFPDSVPEVMDTLRRNFGRPEQIVNRRVAEVRKMPKIQPGDYMAIVGFANVVRNLSGFMRYAQRNERLSDTTLLMELIAKLPVEMQMRWVEYKQGLTTLASIADFSAYLNIVSERATDIKDSLPSTGVTSVQRSNPFSQKPKRHAFVAIGASGSCNMCGGSCANADSCETFNAMELHDRWETVRAKRLCFQCLRSGHMSSQCLKGDKCTIGGCGKQHHELLHAKYENPFRRTDKRRTEKRQTDEVYSAEAQGGDNGVLFQILPVVIMVGDRAINTYAFIDHGSSHSMIDWDLADRLGVQGVDSRLSMQWLANVATDQPTKKVNFEIKGQGEGRRTYRMTQVYTVRNLSLPQQTSKVKGITYRNAQPELIIGLDHAYLTTAVVAPNIHGKGQPITAITKLGPVAYGKCSADYAANESNAERLFVACSMKKKLAELETLMTDYYTNDCLTLTGPPNRMMAEVDMKAMEMMKADTRYVGGRYEVGLLWAESGVEFPLSRMLAQRRLKGVHAKMKVNPEFAAQYIDKMEGFVAKGYARKLVEDKVTDGGRVLYLPHFAVLNPNKKSLRVVFDAAAEVGGRSLNKMLLAGPDLNQSLITILFKFRQSPVAVCGDIKEMFLQIAVKEADQGVQRFLWNSDCHGEAETYVMTRMLFGAKCSPTLAQYVKNLNATEYGSKRERAVDGIINKHYVDDYVDCFNSVEEAIAVVTEVIAIHKRGGFEIRNFVSNSQQLLEAIGEEHSSSEVVSLSEPGVERILGMHWNCTTDDFCFVLKFHRVHKDVVDLLRKPTKREVLSAVMSVFDPFGLLANYVVHGKLLMQELWKAGTQWDAQVPDNLMPKWVTWVKTMKHMELIKVPRCYHSQFALNVGVQLHLFADASENAIAAAAYFRIEDGHEVVTRLVMAKTRCAPLRYVSIPRLELQAAVLATRVAQIVVKAHDVTISRFCYWSDSTTVISWIHSDSRRYKQYVANRIGEILEHTRSNEWRWLPTTLNVADDATRKCSDEFKLNERWLIGPEFLVRDCAQWPHQQGTVEELDDTELKRYALIVVEQPGSADLIDLRRFSNYIRMVRAIAYAQRFIARVRGTFLTVAEVNEAEMTVCRHVQRKVFADEVKALSRGDAVGKKSCLVQLNPYLDERGIIRVCGRLERSAYLSEAEKRQIILPKNHLLSKLVISYYHGKFHHINRATIAAEIQHKFWIPCIRQGVKRCERECNACKIRKSNPKQPVMGPLPPDRIEPYVRPFSYSGLDYFGPVMVSIGRRREKRWVALFTCLTVRAVHLELAADLSSDACLLCVRNFVNRRGVPVQIRSDNGTNFVGIGQELKAAPGFMDDGAIGNGLSNLGIKWVFNCPANPSEGGAWERLVQSVKRALAMILRSAAPKIDTLISALIEAENIVNSRPLTHIPLATSEEEPLTPNHFLLNTANSTQTPGDSGGRLMYSRKQWRIAQTLKNAFWKRWINEYLPELTRRSKWCLPQRPLEVNDLVLICESTMPRSAWRKGVVQELHMGSDGICRSAEVRTLGGVMRRPVSKLAKLDVKSDEI